jgi:hypothetical protein
MYSSALPRRLIEAETDLDILHPTWQIVVKNKPPRGQRARHPTTMLEMWLNNRITRLTGHS